MPSPRATGHSIGPLPYPATKVVIGQYLSSGLQDNVAFWGWLIEAVFYDDNDQRLWATEVFIAQKAY